MRQITFSVPDETLVALHLTPDQLSAELRLAAAIKLHEAGRLSSGAAARLAGVPRPSFLSWLGDYGVDTFCHSEADLLSETRLA